MVKNYTRSPDMLKFPLFMANDHPELEAEQAHIDTVFDALEKTREDALGLKKMVEVGAGGTNQARWEREVFYENILNRLKDLDQGERSLVFGRIDQDEENGGESYHIGRLGVSDSEQNVLVVDWRAPIAEAFYRATGRQTLGLARRRHFTSRGRELLGIEDEFFGDAAGQATVLVNGRELQGEGALIAALEENRSGQLGDIIGTIQAEQDEIIRSGMKGILVVQGGPGTGKTVVALHRAAYLLYEHRFPLDSQGVLVVGPNRLFLGYIEQVLPSLGEAGVELSVLADLVSGVRVKGRDKPLAAKVKGDLRMVDLLARAVRDRQRVLQADAVIDMGARRLRLAAGVTERIVRQARSRYRDHNAARKFVEQEIYQELSLIHPDRKHVDTIREQLESTEQMKELFGSMWPILSPAQLLHDLYGSKALLRSAAKGSLGEEELESLYRPWQEDKDASRVLWRVEDVPVLDEAWELLGPIPKNKDTDYIRTYGHIVVDEAQDLSPLQLRMLTRRSLNGSMTIVGDIGQSTGVWAHNDWQEILEHLPDKQNSFRELTIGYRIPQSLMTVAGNVLAHAAPQVTAPTSVRSGGAEPEVIAVAEPELVGAIVDRARTAEQDGTSGNIAVITPSSLYEAILNEFDLQGVQVGRGLKDGLESSITVVPVHLVKGLEVDVSIVVEPQAMVDEEFQGARSLYVALTRSTKQLTIVHAQDLPAFMGLS